ncbi:MAG: hypothetical protein HFI83_10105 [Eubacterium sp.]|jgi:hypothetical protein|nr:hypothetical protein [Eubacterium sp.]
MAGLQRFISYIYKYENDIKMQNAGFAKVEIRGGICRMEVHIRNISMEPAEITVYLFARKAEIMQGVPVGNIAVSRGCGDVRFAFDIKDLERFGLSMNDMEGIFLPFQDSVCLASQWKEGTITRRQFRILDQPQNREEEKKDEITQTQDHDRAQDAPQAKAVSGGVRQTKDSAEPDGREDAAAQPSQVQNSTESDENAKSDENKQESEQKEPIRATELPMEEFFEENGWEGIFQKLRLKFQVFFPFEGKQIECIRLQLNDLQEFPKKYWYLGNNSFLLHGFFNYRHIIFGMTEEEEKKEFFVGVPGVFLNQERIMATMFGFPEFRTAKSAKYKTGNFGYWYRII